MNEIKTQADLEYLMMQMDEGDKPFAQYLLYESWPSLLILVRRALAQDRLMGLIGGRIHPPMEIVPHSCHSTSKPHPKYSREGKHLLILHNQDCDQFGDITGESPEHLWFTRHGGYFKLSKESGEVETLKPAEF